MGDRRDIVVTAYGHGHIIDRLAISIFEHSDYYHDERKQNADTYCSMINSLELKEGSWVVAKIAYENTPFDLGTFLPFSFEEVISKLDNSAIQKTLREVDSKDLAVALNGAGDDVKERIFANMSSRAVQMLKEDMECMGQVDFQAVRKKRDGMLQIVRILADCGEIIIGED